VLGSRRDNPHHHPTAVVRDVVEVVAIVLAGIWAIYTFIYLERIKPGMQEPRIVMTGSMHKLGEQRGLVAMEFNMTLRNAGQTTVYLIAAAFTGTGVRFTTAGMPSTSTLFNGSQTVFTRDAKIASRTTVYRLVSLTRFANPSYGGGYTIAPNEAVPFSGVFLVRKKDFDEIALDASIGYTKVDSRVYPTRARINPVGVTLIEPANHDPDFDSLQVTLARVMLW
jgi:hypothetical protein